MAAWCPRVARDEDGKLHFVYARYRPEDMRQRCGMVGIGGVFNDGKTIEDMRRLAQQLLNACDQPIINMTEYEYEPAEEGDEEDEDDEDDEDRAEKE